jgi:hypothetical protein
LFEIGEVRVVRVDGKGVGLRFSSESTYLGIEPKYNFVGKLGLSRQNILDAM